MADSSTVRDPRIDAYIERAAEFARPILLTLRERIHAACPEAVETIKWGAPSFTYRGKLLAMMAAFKQHAVLNLWRGPQDDGDDAKAGEAMGQFGRLTTVSDIPGTRALASQIRAVMKRIDEGAPSRPKTARKPPPAAPPDLLAALARNPEARATFEAFPPGKQRDYVDWLLEAKREETRKRRLAQAVEWLAEGKARHWKYESC